MEKKNKYNWRMAFAVVFAVLFGLTLSLSLLAYNIENQLFNPEVYKKAISEENVCERLPFIITRQILSNAENDGGENNLLGFFLKTVDPNTIQNFIRTIFPCQALEATVFTGIDQLFDYINGKTAQETFSLTLFKQSSKENSKIAVEEYYSSLPDCTPAQLLQIGANALLGQEDGNDLLSCNPPDALREVVALPLIYLVESTVQDIPDQLPIARLENLLKALRTSRIVMNWSPLLPLIFLGLTTLMAVRTWRSLLRWWGYPLLTAGVGTLIISLVVSPAIYSLITILIFPNLPVNIVPEAIDLIAGTLEGVSKGLTQPIQYQSAILSLLGLGMILGEKISRPK